tara:strand:- start:724 stop:948 length:225 start_codon:yes stop_codon:yes gene_type:complete
MNFWAIITRITTENKLISFMNNKPIIISPIPISKKVIKKNFEILISETNKKQFRIVISRLNDLNKNKKINEEII